MKYRWVGIAAGALSLALAAGCTKHETSSTETTGATQEGPAAKSEGPAAKPELASEDKEFMTKAAQGGMLEVALGQEVAKRASSPDVKAFGQRMVTDHGKANDELKQLAASKGMLLPTELDAKSRGMRDKLTKLSGPSSTRSTPATWSTITRRTSKSSARRPKT